MGQQIRRIGPKLWLYCALAVWMAALAGVRAQGGSPPPSVEKAPPVRTITQLPGLIVPLPAPSPRAEQTPPAAQVPAAAAGATYVGDEPCLTCHQPQQETYSKSMHGRPRDARTPSAKQGCETCHGPGSKHAEDPVSVKPISLATATADVVTATCTTCHNRGEHALWDGSQHETRGLSCTSCHSVHNFKSDVKQLKKPTQMELCASCHRDKVAKLDRSGHMPVREGKLQCTSCHNVHGATNVRLLRKGDSVAELCTSCHADKRGPYLWEHAPSRDGCVTCHDPHGSSNERMLVAKPPLLCQRCHVGTRHPSTVYDDQLVGGGSNPSIRVFARSCVTCHSAIHGSNHPSGQRFIR